MNAFFDTNILVYAQQTGAKADRARSLLADGGRLSVQVLNEFTSVTRRKQRKSWVDIAAAIEDVLTLVDPPLPLTLDLHAAARTLAQDHQLSFYDALVVAAAMEAGCDTLWSEDFQHGQTIEGVTIRNPFA